jgi:cephalosporin hydroxylase
MDDFDKRNQDYIERMAHDQELRELSARWFNLASKYEYSYHFKWLGRPIIQFPQDVLAVQELIWDIRPDLIVETGVARGGSLILYASLLKLLENNGRVVGIDIDIRPHNRKAIEAHPLAGMIDLVQGSSIDPRTVEQVHKLRDNRQRTLVILDSNHTHDHVLQELRAYSPWVQRGSYVVVFDTIVEFMPQELIVDRPWKKGDNPYTAVQSFLKENDRFEVDESYQRKLLLSVCPSGFLRCIRD